MVQQIRRAKMVNHHIVPVFGPRRRQIMENRKRFLERTEGKVWDESAKRFVEKDEYTVESDGDNV